MIYQNHIAKGLLYHFIVIAGAIISVIWLSQIMKLSFVIELGATSLSFLFLSFSAIPTIAVMLVPISVVIAFFGKYTFFASDRELVALEASGLSNMQIAVPGIRLSMYIAIIVYSFSLWLGPVSYHFLKSRLSNFHDYYFKNVIHTGAFNQVSSNFILYIDSKDSKNMMQEIIIFDNRKTTETAIIFAKKGSLYLERNVPVFMLYDGIRQTINKRGNLNQMTFENLKISMPKNNSKRSINKQDLQEYNIIQLMFPDKKLYTQKRLGQIKAEMHQRLIWPAYSIIFAMITIGIFLQSPFKRTTDYKAAIKLAATILLIIYLHFAFYNLASANILYILVCYLIAALSAFYGYFILRD